jgi:FKBP-type peptidyl-prolyl cis-trans isomerase
MNKYLASLGVFLVLVLVGCSNQDTPNNERQLTKKQIDEQLLQANRSVLQTEKEQIDFLISRYKWVMTTTETGLRYRIYYKSANSYFPVDGDEVKLSFSLKNIKGDLIYSSEIDGDIVMELGKSDQPSGLQELIRLMNKGDKANAIIPSHLAYGLVGDGSKIPGKTSLVYDIELIGIYKHTR